MLRTSASLLALSTLLAAATATASLAQTTTEDDADVTVIEPDGDTTEADAVVIEEAPAEGEATVVQEEAPAEGEAVVIEEAPAEADVTVVEEQAPAEGEAVVVEGADAEPVEQPVEGQMFEQSPDQVLASTLLDATVVSPADETIGDVNDMVLSADGQVTGVVIGVGGFLGIGEKQVAIEYDRIEVRQGEDGELSFVLDATQDQLEAAPEFRTRDEVEAEAAIPAAGTEVGTDAGMAPTEGTIATDPAATAVPLEEPAEEEVVKPAD